MSYTQRKTVRDCIPQNTPRRAWLLAGIVSAGAFGACNHQLTGSDSWQILRESYLLPAAFLVGVLAAVLANQLFRFFEWRNRLSPESPETEAAAAYAVASDRAARGLEHADLRHAARALQTTRDDMLRLVEARAGIAICGCVLIVMNGLLAYALRTVNDVSTVFPTNQLPLVVWTIVVATVFFVPSLVLSRIGTQNVNGWYDNAMQFAGLESIFMESDIQDARMSESGSSTDAPESPFVADSTDDEELASHRPPPTSTEEPDNPFSDFEEEPEFEAVPDEDFSSNHDEAPFSKTVPDDDDWDNFDSSDDNPFERSE